MDLVGFLVLVSDEEKRAYMYYDVFCVDGPYGNFAGRDASRGMAKQSFDLGASDALSTPYIQKLII